MTDNNKRYTNHLLSKDEISMLAKTHDQHCVSIYVPTHGAGEEVNQHMGKLSLKNCIKKLKLALKDYQLSEKDVSDYIYPVERLLDDNNFWRDQSDCLVIFLNKESMRYYKLPVPPREFIYVSDHFYLLPIIPLFSENGKFYILTLSLKKVKLFECSSYSIAEISIDDFVPGTLEEVVGADIQNKSLQFRTGQGGEAGAIYHGQGCGKDDKDIEVEKFLRAVDAGIMKTITDKNFPLVLASVDRYHPMYKNISSYPNLNDQHINGNRDEEDPLLLHEMALPLIEHHFDQTKRKAENLIKEREANWAASFDLNEIIPASIDGRVQALFVRDATDKYGLYDKVNRSLIVDQDINSYQTSLYNLAAVQTWINGGQIYLVGKDEMPITGTTINALFRY